MSRMGSADGVEVVLQRFQEGLDTFNDARSIKACPSLPLVACCSEDRSVTIYCTREPASAAVAVDASLAPPLEIYDVQDFVWLAQPTTSAAPESQATGHLITVDSLGGIALLEVRFDNPDGEDVIPSMVWSADVRTRSLSRDVGPLPVGSRAGRKFQSRVQCLSNNKNIRVTFSTYELTTANIRDTLASENTPFTGSRVSAVASLNELSPDGGLPFVVIIEGLVAVTLSYRNQSFGVVCAFSLTTPRDIVGNVCASTMESPSYKKVQASHAGDSNGDEPTNDATPSSDANPFLTFTDFDIGDRWLTGITTDGIVCIWDLTTANLLTVVSVPAHVACFSSCEDGILPLTRDSSFTAVALGKDGLSLLATTDVLECHVVNLDHHYWHHSLHTPSYNLLPRECQDISRMASAGGTLFSAGENVRNTLGASAQGNGGGGQDASRSPQGGGRVHHDVLDPHSRECGAVTRSRQLPVHWYDAVVHHDGSRRPDLLISAMPWLLAPVLASDGSVLDPGSELASNVSGLRRRRDSAVPVLSKRSDGVPSVKGSEPGPASTISDARGSERSAARSGMESESLSQGASATGGVCADSTPSPSTLVVSFAVLKELSAHPDFAELVEGEGLKTSVSRVLVQGHYAILVYSMQTPGAIPAVVVYRHDLETNEAVPVKLDRGCVPIIDSPGTLLFVSNSGVRAWIADSTQDQILTNAVMTGRPAEADVLCAINDWDRRTLRIHALQLGLRHRQLETIEQGLDSIDPDQHVVASRLLIDSLTGQSSILHDREFTLHLLPIGLKFITSALHTRIAEQTKASRGDGSAEAITQLTKDLKELRQVQVSLVQKRKLRSHLGSPHRRGGAGGVNRRLDLGSTLSGRRRTISMEPGIDLMDLESLSEASIESLTELTSSQLKSRWQSLAPSRSQLLLEAALTGRLSLAMSLYPEALDISAPSAEPETDLPETSAVTIKSVRAHLYPVIYQLVCRGKIDAAVLMLRNLGDDVGQSLREIAMATESADVRESLFDHPCWVESDECDVTLINTGRALQQTHPFTDYGDAFAALERHPLGQALPVQDPAEPVENADAKSDMFVTGDGDKPYELPPNAEVTHPPSEHPRRPGYAVFSLSQVASWKEGTARKVLEEGMKGSPIEKRPSVAEATMTAATGQEPDFVLLEYCCLHHDTYGLVKWVSSLDLSTVCLDENGVLSHVNIARGTLARETASSKSDAGELRPALGLIDKIESVRNVCSPAMLKLLSLALGRRGVFLSNDTQSFDRLTHRLAYCHALFPHSQHVPSVGGSDGSGITDETRELLETLRPGRNDHYARLLPRGELAPFHDYFVNLLAHHRLANVLQVYIDLYDLSTPLSSRDTEKTADLQWLNLLLQSRTPGQLFEKSLASAAVVLQSAGRSESSDTIGIEAMFASGRPHMGFASLLFTGKSLQECISAEETSPEFVSLARFQQFAKAFPLLAGVVQEVDKSGNSKGAAGHHYGVALSPEPAESSGHVVGKPLDAVDLDKRSVDIISGHNDVDVRQLLVTASSTPLDFADFAYPDTIDSSGFVVLSAVREETLDALYYMSTCRPLEAFRSLVKTSSGANAAMEEPVLAVEDLRSLLTDVWELALTQCDDKAVTASCLLFLELCRVPSHSLAIDTQALCRIFEHTEDVSRSEIIDLVLSSRIDAATPASATAAQTLLEHLERSTDIHEQVTAPTRRRVKHVTDTLAIETDDSAWALVSQFCAVHNLPPSTKYLRELASRGHWVIFLFEAQKHITSIDLLISIVEECVPHPSLKQHLVTTMRAFSSDSAKQVSDTGTGDRDDESTLALLWSASQSQDPSAMCLELALKTKKSIFAVFAACSSQPPPLTALLYTYLACGYDRDHDELSTPFSDITLAHVQQLVVDHVKDGHVLYALRALQIFDPLSPLAIYVLFHHQFVQARYTEAEGTLARYVEARSQDSLSMKLGDREWMEATATSLAEVLHRGAPTLYESHRLLRTLAKVEFNDHYVVLGDALLILQDVTDMTCDLSEDPNEVFDHLVEHGNYQPARKYAALYSLDGEQATLAEVKSMIAEYRSGSLWPSAHERLTLWRRVQGLLVGHGAHAETAGSLLVEQADTYRSVLTAPETRFLLAKAIAWFSGQLTHSSPMRSPEYIQELEDRRTFASASAEHASPARAAGIGTTEGDSEQTTMYLNTVIGKLLATGQVAEAKRLSIHYGYETTDILVVQAMSDLVNEAVTPGGLSTDVLALVESRFPGAVNPVHFTPMKAIDVLVDLSGPGARTFCLQARVIYKVALALQSTYQRVRDDDPYGLLQILLLSGQDQFKLVQQFITLKGLDEMRVASILAEYYAKVLSTAVNDPNVRSAFDPFCSAQDFMAFASLGGVPTLLGDQLVELGQGHDEDRNLRVEVEFLIRAHMCYDAASAPEHKLRVIRVIRSRVKAYVASGEYRLLVRILVGTQNYVQLKSLFDILITDDQFEQLLRKTFDKAAQASFQGALVQYLKDHHTHSHDKLVMVYLRFGMYRALGELYHHRAQDRIDDVLAAVASGAPASSLEEALHGEMGHLLQAADSYIKDKCYKKANECMALATMYGLQIEAPHVKIVGLSIPELKHLLSTHHNFEQAHMIACGYNVAAAENWVAPLYAQIVAGNMSFFEGYKGSYPDPPQLYRELASHFKMDPEQARHTATFINFLAKVKDLSVRHEIARDLGLTSIVNSSSAALDITHAPKQQPTRGRPDQGRGGSSRR